MKGIVAFGGPYAGPAMCRNADMVGLSLWPPQLDNNIPEKSFLTLHQEPKTFGCLSAGFYGKDALLYLGYLGGPLFWNYPKPETLNLKPPMRHFCILGSQGTRDPLGAQTRPLRGWQSSDPPELGFRGLERRV